VWVVDETTHLGAAASAVARTGNNVKVTTSTLGDRLSRIGDGKRCTSGRGVVESVRDQSRANGDGRRWKEEWRLCVGNGHKIFTGQKKAKVRRATTIRTGNGIVEAEDY